MLHILKWLMLLMMILLAFLLGMFFQIANCEAVAEAETVKTSLIESNKINERDIIGQIFSDYDHLKQDSCSTDKNMDGLRIFISFSMPETLLEQYDQIAKKIGAKLVLRGFKNNSFKETVNYIQAISAEGIVVEIDPIAYKKFAITSVPSFVLSRGNNLNDSAKFNNDNSLSDEGKFDKLVGNVSVHYALTKFKDEGDLSIQAQEYLARFKSNERK